MGQDYEEAFCDVQQQFEQRLPTTQSNLKDYLDDYPYTPYADEVLTMQGVLYTEKEKYKNGTLSEERIHGSHQAACP